MKLQTKYGVVNSDLKTFIGKIFVGRIFKLLPLQQERNPTLVECHKSLMHDLCGGEKALIPLHGNPHFLLLICAVESLMLIEDDKEYRSKVFECINICKSLV